MASEPRSVLGLTAVTVEPLRRVPLRTRESAVTKSGWRLELRCGEGQGALVVAEDGAKTFWRGEGVLLGWPQEKLAELHAALTAAHATEEDSSGPQLG